MPAIKNDVVAPVDLALPSKMIAVALESCWKKLFPVVLIQHTIYMFLDILPTGFRCHWALLCNENSAAAKLYFAFAAIISFLEENA